MRFDNSNDVIDSRDIIARIAELESDIEDTEACLQEDGDDCSCGMPLDSHDLEEAREELTTLRALEEEASSSPDWTYGETLIRDSYFEDDIRDYFDQTCDLKDVPELLLDCIDWEQVAERCQADYMEVDYDGVSYWIRV